MLSERQHKKIKRSIYRISKIKFRDGLLKENLYQTLSVYQTPERAGMITTKKGKTCLILSNKGYYIYENYFEKYSIITLTSPCIT